MKTEANTCSRRQARENVFEQAQKVTKGVVTRRIFSYNLQRNADENCCETSCGWNCACNTPLFATCQQRKIALRVSEKTLLYFSQRCEASCARVTINCNLSRSVFVSVASQVARKLALCSSTLTLSLPRVPTSKFKKSPKLHFVKHWKTNCTMQKYCRRGFIWMVTP